MDIVVGIRERIRWSIRRKSKPINSEVIKCSEFVLWFLEKKDYSFIESFGTVHRSPTLYSFNVEFRGRF